MPWPSPPTDREDPRERPHILVVDDDAGARIDLVDYLTLRGFAALGVGTAADMRQVFVQRPPDAVLLDNVLPDGDGFALTRQIRSDYGPACGIVMLTGLAAVEDRVEGLNSGADAYLVKHTTLREIDATLRSVLRRAGGAAISVATVPREPSGQWLLDPQSWRLISPVGAAAPLTATEFAFLKLLLVERAGAICARAELIETLGRPSMRFNERNLDDVVRRLRRKVVRHCGLDAPIRMVYGTGYVFVGDGVG